MAEVQKAALESYNKIKAERGEVTALDMFIAGRDWFKDQMMKDAIDARILAIGQNAIVREENEDDLRKYLLSKFHNGDKVKVIIIKE